MFSREEKKDSYPVAKATPIGCARIESRCFDITNITREAGTNVRE
jgi:hypothetical protein